MNPREGNSTQRDSAARARAGEEGQDPVSNPAPVRCQLPYTARVHHWDSVMTHAHNRTQPWPALVPYSLYATITMYDYTLARVLDMGMAHSIDSLW